MKTAADKKLHCKDHQPRFDREEGNTIFYRCTRCFWQGSFRMTNANPQQGK